MMDRRKFLNTAAVGVPALAIAGCGTVTDPNTIATSVIDYIQNAVSSIAGYIPIAESIAAVAASLFGPAWVAAVQIGSTAINTLITALANLAPVASVRLRAVPRRTPVVIGTVNGIQVIGYR